MQDIIGIDPGKAGGIVRMSPTGEVIEAVKMPATVADIYLALDRGPARVWLEHVHSSPQMGVVSAFTFGRGYGQLEGVLQGLLLPYERVTPGKWQRAMGCLSKGDKNVTKRRAQELFPQVKVTHAIADALLIAEYGRRQGL